MTRYDEIVQALTELKGEAKLEDNHKKILDNVAFGPPSKGTVGGTLLSFKEPKEGRKYSFHSLGKGVWKLVENQPSAKAKAKNKPKPVTSTPIIGQRTSVTVENLPSFIGQIIEPLKKDGGQISITVEVIYRPRRMNKAELDLGRTSC